MKSKMNTENGEISLETIKLETGALAWADFPAGSNVYAEKAEGKNLVNSAPPSTAVVSTAESAVPTTAAPRLVKFSAIARLFDQVPASGPLSPAPVVELSTEELMACLQVPLLINMFQLLDDKDGKQVSGWMKLISREDCALLVFVRNASVQTIYHA